MPARKLWAVEVTDPHPTLGGKVVRGDFVWKRDAEIWADREVEAAAEIGIPGVTARVYAVQSA